jgi:hypothetical protein
MEGVVRASARRRGDERRVVDDSHARTDRRRERDE